MTRWLARSSVPLLLVLALGGTTVVAAAPSAPIRESVEVVSARQHFKAGEKAFNAGDYARALREFEAGYLLVPRAGFLLNMAHTERKLGHGARARELYQRYLDTDPLSAERAGVPGLIAELDRSLGASARGEAMPVAPPVAVPHPAAVTNPMTPSPETVPETAVAPAVSGEAAPVEVPPLTAGVVPLPAAPPPAEEPAVVVSAAPSEEPRGPTAQRPVYKHWWFWAVIGVAAVGATTTAILATRPAMPAFQDDGTLGRVGP